MTDQGVLEHGTMQTKTSVFDRVCEDQDVHLIEIFLS